MDFQTVLSGGAAGVLGLVILVLLRMIGHDRRQLADADARYRAEVAQHEETERALDDQRTLRRQMEDKVAELTRSVAALTAKVDQQTAVIAEQTRVIAAQTTRIGLLEAEVERLVAGGGTLTGR